MRPKTPLFIVLTLVCLSVANRSHGYHWPLSAPPALTSTFAEHRSGHLHAGLDLKTWGQEGYQVYAVGDGYVWRIRTSPWGYGKAVYIRLRDGRTAVYGHLASFAPFIERALEAEQERTGRYSVDLYPAPEEIPVRGGQVVAHSGRTGCAHPHLHFELRDENNSPLNPLCHGFAVSDGRAPRMTSVSIRALDWSSAIDGEEQRQLYPLQWNASRGRFGLSRTPHIEGRAGLALAVYDLADGAENRLNVYALEMYLDGLPVFTATYDIFSFDNWYKVTLETDFELYRRGRGIFHNLYVAPGNDLPFYHPARIGAGIIDASAHQAGFHDVRIRAADQDGNAAEAQFSVLLDRRPRVSETHVREDSLGLQVDVRASDPDGAVTEVWVEYSVDGGRRWISRPAVAVLQEGLFRAWIEGEHDPSLLVRAWAKDEFGVHSHPDMTALAASPRDERADEPQFRWEMNYYRDHGRLLIHSDRPLADEPRVFLNRPGSEPRRVPMYCQEPDQCAGRLLLTGGQDGDVVVTIAGRDLSGRLGVAAFTLPVTTITPGGGGTLGDLDDGIMAVFEPGTVYQTVLGRVEQKQVETPPGLPLKSKAFALFPDNCPFDRPATVWIQLPAGEEANERIAVYRRSRSGKWGYLDRLSSDDGLAVGARVKSLGTFVLLEDGIEPLIWRVRPRDGATIQQGRPVLSAKVRDTGSGIGSELDVILKLDGQRLISRYDPPIEAVLYQPREPLGPGQHVLEVEVIDRAGNRSQATSRFTVTP
jgi:hypothetical protein